MGCGKEEVPRRLRVYEMGTNKNTIVKQQSLLMLGLCVCDLAVRIFSSGGSCENLFGLALDKEGIYHRALDPLGLAGDAQIRPSADTLATS